MSSEEKPSSTQELPSAPTSSESNAQQTDSGLKAAESSATEASSNIPLSESEDKALSSIKNVIEQLNSKDNEPLDSKVNALLKIGRKAIAKGLSQDKAPQEFNELLDEWPLIPNPVVVSKLYKKLSSKAEQEKLPMFVNSFDVLKSMILAEKELMRAVGVEKKEKHTIAQKKEQILRVVLQRVFWMFTDLLQLSKQDMLKTFVAENFYTSMNCIRAFEFTILDLLNIPKHKQGEWVTPDFILLPEEPTAQQALAKALQTDTLRILQRRLQHYPSLNSQHQIPTELPLDIQGWASVSAIEVTLSWVREELKKQRWRCANVELCKKTEKTPGEFKQCSNCGWIRYCSRECQVLHWKQLHKLYCRKALPLSHIDKHRIIVGAD